MKVVLLLAVLLLVCWAQFPAVCNTQDSLNTIECDHYISLYYFNVVNAF